jgi:hypothetical protein
MVDLDLGARQLLFLKVVRSRSLKLLFNIVINYFVFVFVLILYLKLRVGRTSLTLARDKANGWVRNEEGRLHINFSTLSI